MKLIVLVYLKQHCETIGALLGTFRTLEAIVLENYLERDQNQEAVRINIQQLQAVSE